MVTQEQRDNAAYCLINNLRGTHYYETKHVRRGRKEKICSCCGDRIERGEPAWTIIFYGEDNDWPSHDICANCYNDNEEAVAVVRQVENGEWDVDN